MLPVRSYSPDAADFYCVGTTCDVANTAGLAEPVADFETCCKPGGDTKTNVSHTASFPDPSFAVLSASLLTLPTPC